MSSLTEQLKDKYRGLTFDDLKKTLHDWLTCSFCKDQPIAQLMVDFLKERLSEFQPPEFSLRGFNELNRAGNFARLRKGVIIIADETDTYLYLVRYSRKTLPDYFARGWYDPSDDLPGQDDGYRGVL